MRSFLVFFICWNSVLHLCFRSSSFYIQDFILIFSFPRFKMLRINSKNSLWYLKAVHPMIDFETTDIRLSNRLSYSHSSDSKKPFCIFPSSFSGQSPCWDPIPENRSDLSYFSKGTLVRFLSKRNPWFLDSFFQWKFDERKLQIDGGYLFRVWQKIPRQLQKYRPCHQFRFFQHHWL